MSEPDLMLMMHRGMEPIVKYHNPDLLAGMFPTLYPFGIGGFDDTSRPTPLSFQAQADYYFNLADKSFRQHCTYMFVALNIQQRRMAHLHTHFTVHRSHFETLARSLTSVSPQTLRHVADHLQREHNYSNLSVDDRSALNLLMQVNTITARVPGSQASKMYVRNEIRSYFGFFGMPHVFFTCNPNASHSPIFQVMYGDETVDLTARYPVAAADFFQYSVTSLFAHLFGWDYSSQCSTVAGGILGHLEAFYSTCE
ncbi:hypothetical protein EV702DRAFT_924236, partial [Suillus placidus]